MMSLNGSVEATERHGTGSSEIRTCKGLKLLSSKNKQGNKATLDPPFVPKPRLSKEFKKAFLISHNDFMNEIMSKNYNSSKVQKELSRDSLAYSSHQIKISPREFLKEYSESPAMNI